jgi:hypothetical protein
MAELIRNHGGEPIQAPSMREIPLADQYDALAFGEALLTRKTPREDPLARRAMPENGCYVIYALEKGSYVCFRGLGD